MIYHDRDQERYIPDWVCVFCNQVFLGTTSMAQMRDHMCECPKHPIAEFKRENRLLWIALGLFAASYFCFWCAR